jgi:hypothetical protein
MSVDGRLATSSAAGGTAVVFSGPDSARGETGQFAPVALPDGKTVLYTSMAMGGSAASRIGVATIGDSATTILEIQGTYALGVIDGYLVFGTAGGVIQAVPFDLAGRRVTGIPVPLVDQVATQTGSPWMHADLAPDGVLAYVSGMRQRRLLQLQPDGSQLEILADAGFYGTPRLSPDGRRVALSIGTSSRSDLYVYDLPGGPLVRLTTEGTTNDRPEWMPGGRSLLYRSNRSGPTALWTIPLDGSSSTQMLFGLPDARIDEGVVSPDGQYLLYQVDRTGRGELFYRRLTGDTTAKRVGNGPFGEVGARFSPDGKWIAYSSSESSIAQIYVRPFPSLAARYQVSLSGGATPLWSPDGTRLYYVAGRDLIAATIGSTEPFIISARTILPSRGFTFAGIHADYDVLKDGRTLIALRPNEDDVRLVAVQNWRTELLTRMQSATR